MKVKTIQSKNVTPKVTIILFSQQRIPHISHFGSKMVTPIIYLLQARFASTVCAHTHIGITEKINKTKNRKRS